LVIHSFVGISIPACLNGSQAMQQYLIYDGATVAGVILSAFLSGNSSQQFKLIICPGKP
jgi:hypothetical protein